MLERIPHTLIYWEEVTCCEMDPDDADRFCFLGRVGVEHEGRAAAAVIHFGQRVAIDGPPKPQVPCNDKRNEAEVSEWSALWET